MSERKVLNKYYPPDFDPSKIPKLRLAKERQYTVRIMAPFNMQCKMCNDYIYKGKKFNAKTENVHNENYLGLRIYRFYIRCPRCISEIVFKTDPENQDYTLELGATRLFEAVKLLQAAEEEDKKQAEEDATNPMKVLEKRTKDSKLEMEVMENLEELRELNMRKRAIDYEEILKQGAELEAERLNRQEEEDEAEIRRIFGKEGGDGIIIKRLADDEEEDNFSKPSPSYSNLNKRPTDFLTEDSPDAKKQKFAENSTRSSSKMSSKSLLSGLVRVKKSTSTPSNTTQPSVGGTTLSPPNTTQTSVSGATLTASNTTQTSVTGTSVESSNSANIQKELTGSKTGTSVSNSENAEESVSSEKKDEKEEEDKEEFFAKSIQEGLAKQTAASKKATKEKSSGLSLLGGYDFSDSDISDSGSDS